MMCALDCGYKSTSDELPFSDSGCEDCVVISESACEIVDGVQPWRPLEVARRFLRSKLHDVYLSIVFTRSPSVVLSASQRTALPMITLVRGIEQLLRLRMKSPDASSFRSTPGLVTHVRNMVCLMLTIRSTVLRTKDGSLLEWALEIVQAMLFSSRPQDHLTEAPPAGRSVGGVASVCQVLGVLCCADAAEPLFNSPEVSTVGTSQLTRVSLALLAEAVSRSCRVQIKTEASSVPVGEQPYRRLLRKALGITKASCHDVSADGVPEADGLVHSSEIELKAGAAASGHFFEKTFTNCTPWAIVACIGWAQTIASAARAHNEGFERSQWLDSALSAPDSSALRTLCEAVMDAFQDPKVVSMRRFAKRFIIRDAALDARDIDPTRNYGLEVNRC